MSYVTSYPEILAAANRLSAVVSATPLVENANLNERLGGRIFIKAETLQRAGSFKFRGAYNRLSQLDVEQKKRGVVAWSSGNHAQGVAAAARILDIQATIVMPEDAPQIKIEATKGYGADIIFYDRYKEDREVIGRKLCQERGAVLVPSYDDPHIIAGQGTVGLELVAQFFEQCDGELHQVLMPCGGGGLCAGSALAVEMASPNTSFYGVEPEDFNDTARSIRAGSFEQVDPKARSICDALQAGTPGRMTLPINRDKLTDVLIVSDIQVMSAMAYAWQYLKLVVEPGGAVALAAVLAGQLDCQNKNTVITLSGGNVDRALFNRALEQGVVDDAI